MQTLWSELNSSTNWSVSRYDNSSKYVCWGKKSKTNNNQTNLNQSKQTNKQDQKGLMHDYHLCFFSDMQNFYSLQQFPLKILGNQKFCYSTFRANYINPIRALTGLSETNFFHQILWRNLLRALDHVESLRNF